ncbi:LOW QUALITY PROTEIN: uncharacterized protein LOC144351995 [Saccoglossus kowalevskii]
MGRSDKVCTICVNEFETSNNLRRHYFSESHKRERVQVINKDDLFKNNTPLDRDSEDFEIVCEADIPNQETTQEGYITGMLISKKLQTDLLKFLGMYGMDEDIPFSNPNPWHPFPNEHYAELINAPRQLGDGNLQFVFHLLRKRAPSIPSYYQVKQICAKLPGRLESNMFVDSDGRSNHSLSIIDVIRQRMATPDTAARLARYSQTPLDGVIRGMYQSQKWMLNRQYHTRMIKEHEQDLFVKDVVTYKSKKIIGYISAFNHASLCVREISSEKNVRGKKVVSVPVVLFSDDVVGSTTNKLNSFSVWYLLLGCLPKKDNSKLQNILLLNASNSVNASELSEPLVSELKILKKNTNLMQFPRASSDLLILAPSLNLAPRFVVTVALSEPAKSISDILATFTSALSPAVRAFCLTNTYMCLIDKQWDSITSDSPI